MFVVLGIRHVMRMRQTVICGLSGYTIFFSPHYFINGTIFEEKVFEYKMGFDFLYNFCMKHLSFQD